MQEANAQHISNGLKTYIILHMVNYQEDGNKKGI